MLFFTAILIGTLLSQNIYSNEILFEKLNKCETVKRLDSPGRSLEKHPIQDQGKLSTCYANVSSVVFLAKLKKENPNITANQLSWVQLAFERKKEYISKIDNANYQNGDIARHSLREGGYMCDIYEVLKDKNLCAIDSDYWDENFHKKSLEGNPSTLYKIVSEYEQFINTDDIYEKFSDQLILFSPNCLDARDRNLDQFLSEKINVFKNEPAFAKLWGMLQEPKVENLKKIKNILVNKYIEDKFLLKSSDVKSLSYSKSIQKREHDFFFSFNKNEIDQLALYLVPAFRTEDDFSVSFRSIFDDFEKEFVKSINQKMEPFYNESNHRLISCIDQTLQGVELGVPEVGQCQSLKYEKESLQIYNFFQELVRKNVNPKQALMMINDKRVKTKVHLLDNLIETFYDDCSIKLPSGWDCGFLDKSHLAAGDEGKVFDVLTKVIDKDEAAYLGVNYNFFLSPSNIDPGNKTTHAVSVIGYAKNCNGQEQCFLVQNSLGEDFEDQESAKMSRPKELYPDKTLEQVFIEEDGSEAKYYNQSFGKFWVCDKKYLNKYFDNLSGFNK